MNCLRRFLDGVGKERDRRPYIIGDWVVKLGVFEMLGRPNMRFAKMPMN